MYADRHHRSSAIDPRSLGIAVALNGAVVAALMLANPVIQIIRPDPPLHLIKVPIEPDPKPLPPPKPDQHPRTQQRPIDAPVPPIPLPRNPDSPTAPDPLPPIPLSGSDQGLTLLPEPTSSATPTPVTIGPEIDPAHRGELQPAYPAGELRAEHQGVVSVRVLVGTDGRVHAVEQISATSDAFFRATQERALARWRFKPATRGGVPIEAWRTMTIRFVIPN